MLERSVPVWVTGRLDVTQGKNWGLPGGGVVAFYDTQPVWLELDSQFGGKLVVERGWMARQRKIK